jgi:hypothetical protein
MFHLRHVECCCCPPCSAYWLCGQPLGACACVLRVQVVLLGVCRAAAPFPNQPATLGQGRHDITLTPLPT